MQALRSVTRGSLLLFLLVTTPTVWISEVALAAGPYVVVRNQPPASRQGAVVSFGVTRNDYEYLKQLSTVSYSVPIRVIRNDVRHRDRQNEVSVVGTTETLQKILGSTRSGKMARGRYLTADDVLERANVAVLAESLAIKLFPDTDALGQHVVIAGNYFLVVGIFTVSEDRFPENPLPGSVHIPLTTMRVRHGDVHVSRRGGTFEGQRFELSQVWLSPRTSSALSTLRRSVEQVLTLAHHTPDYTIDIVR